MKFIISTHEFKQLLGKIRNVVASKSSVPILGNLLIEASNDEVIVTATDLTVAMRCVLEAKVLQEGGTALPAKLLAQLVSELPATHLEITTNAHNVTEIVAGASRFKLHGMSQSDFPEFPEMEEGIHLTVKQSELKDMLFRTAFAVSREDNRFVLTGVFMNIENGMATFVGTDGKRLSRTRLSVLVDQGFSGSYIIPLKAVEEILKILGEEGEAKLILVSDRIAIEASGTMLLTKLLRGDYPDVNRVIPAAPAVVIALHREELIALLRQISLFKADPNQSVRFTFVDGELTVTANVKEIGEGRVKMPVNYKGEKLEIAFNPTNFLDVLRHCKKERVLLGLDDSYNPGVITDQEEAPLLTNALIPLYVLMPMRLSSDNEE